MLNTKYNKANIKDKIIKLRLELYKEYEKYGNSERVVKKSQELDKYISIQQKQLIKNKLEL